jgi:hypothetical protein
MEQNWLLLFFFFNKLAAPKQARGGRGAPARAIYGA